MMSRLKICVSPFPQVDDGEAEVCSEVVDDEADGDLAEEGLVQLLVHDVDEEGEQEEDARDQHSSWVENVGDVLQDKNMLCVCQLTFQHKLIFLSISIKLSCSSKVQFCQFII